MFEQGNYSPGGCGEMGPLRAYLLAKLLWNPECDLAKHRAEFLGAYFGKAAPAIQNYLELLEAQVRGGKAHAHIFDSPKAAYLSAEFSAKAVQLLDQALAVAENEAVRNRVEVARLPVWYVMLANDRVAGEERADLLGRFLAIARRAGISNISEGQALDAWAKGMGGG